MIYLTNSQALQDNLLSWTVKIVELSIYFEEPQLSGIEYLFDWFWSFNFFCGSQPVPRLVNSGIAV